MSGTSGEDSARSSSSSSSSSSDSNGEGEAVVLGDKGGISVDRDPTTAAESSSASPDGEEDTNSGYADPESPNSNSSSSEGVLVEHPAGAEQDSRLLQADPDSGILVNIDLSMQEHAEEDDGNRRGEDMGRDDMFVDAPDQLGFSDGRSSGGLEESMAMIEIGESTRERQLLDEVERVHAQLNETVAECRKYKEERELFGREVDNLRYGLQALADRQSLLAGGGSEEMLEHCRGADKNLEASLPLHSMLIDCSNVASQLKSILDEQLQCKATIGELHALLSTKDEEIEDLNVKLSESSMSRDVISSYIGSAQFETLKEYSDAAVKRLLASLASVVNQENDTSGDAAEEIYLVEKKTELLIERYSRVLHEINQLGQCLATIKPDFAIPEGHELGILFEAVRLELLESRTKESNFLEKISELEKEKSEMLEQIDKMKENVEESKSETSKAKMELEHAENKLLSAKEKLSMAVTKGKSLVQHRDSLKQSLAEKTSELEKCLQELKQKSIALEAAGEVAEAHKQSQELVITLQNSISDRDRVLQRIEEDISQIDVPQDLQSMDVTDRVRWLIDQKRISEEMLLESHKIRDSLSSFDIPEAVSSAVEHQISWLGTSLAQSKEDGIKLQDELVSLQAAFESCVSELMVARKEIENLTETLAVEKQANESVQALHDDLISENKGVAESLSQVLSEKSKLMRVLQEVSESTLDDALSADMDALIDQCIGRIREKTESLSEPSIALVEGLQSMQTVLYIRSQELALCEKMLEEEMVDKSKMIDLSDELGRSSEEVVVLRNERDSLRKDLERVEERSSLLREKLSMAVKKGKGLVQEREGFKLSLDEKNSEIEKLKHELELQESVVVEYKQQINSLTSDLEHSRKLESDIISVKEERGQIEKFLLESNSTLQRVIESIEQIVLPSDRTFETPVERVNQIAQHIHDCEAGKVHAEQELEKAREEAGMLANRLEDAYKAIKSLEEDLSKAEKHISVILEEKKDVEVGKASAESELERLKEDFDTLSGELNQAHDTVKIVKDALAKAENRTSQLESESQLEIGMLNAKIAACMEELAGTHGNLEKQSTEVVNHLRHLQLLTKDEGLLSLIAEIFRKNAEDLRNTVPLIKGMHDMMHSDESEAQFCSQPDSALSKLFFLPQFEDYLDDKAIACGMGTDEPADDILSITKVTEEFSAHTKILKERLAHFSNYMNDHIKHLLLAVEETRDELAYTVGYKESLKVNANKLEALSQAQEVELSALQNNIKTLVSACSDATEVLQIDFHSMLNYDNKLEQNWTPSLDLESTEPERDGNGVSEPVTTAEKLLLAVRKFKTQRERIMDVKSSWMKTIEDLKSNLEEAESTAESAIRDKDISQEKVDILKRELESLQTIHSDLKFKLDDYQDKEIMWKDKEEEILSLQHQLAVKAGEGDKKVALEDQMQILFEHANNIEIPFKELEVNALEQQFSSPMDKLFYIVNNVATLQYMLNSIVVEKENMQSVLTGYVDEIEELKKAAKSFSGNDQELEKKTKELNELTVNLERIIQKMGGNASQEDKRILDAKGSISVLERLVLTLTQESEGFKSRALELAAKLQASQKAVDELSVKVKLLEDSAQARSALAETKERSIFEGSSSITGPEISEIEDVGSLGKKSVSTLPSAAAHVRTMRKGSSDHLALDIDLESDQLISSYETDDKGHVFKSLNMSGFIPKQGKLVADRIDSIWVSGGRILMSRPRVRMGLIAYWILLHIWVLGTIL